MSIGNLNIECKDGLTVNTSVTVDGAKVKGITKIELTAEPLGVWSAVITLHPGQVSISGALGGVERVPANYFDMDQVQKRYKAIKDEYAKQVDAYFAVHPDTSNCNHSWSSWDQLREDETVERSFLRCAVCRMEIEE